MYNPGNFSHQGRPFYVIIDDKHKKLSFNSIRFKDNGSYYKLGNIQQMVYLHEKYKIGKFRKFG